MEKNITQEEMELNPEQVVPETPESPEQEVPEMPEVAEQQSAPEQPPVRKLFDVLKEQELYTKSFDEFKQKYSTPQEIEKLHSIITAPDYELYTKPLADFENQYFPELKKKDVSPSGTTEPKATSATAQAGESLPTTAQIPTSSEDGGPQVPETAPQEEIDLSKYELELKERGYTEDDINKIRKDFNNLPEGWNRYISKNYVDRALVEREANPSQYAKELKQFAIQVNLAKKGEEPRQKFTQAYFNRPAPKVFVSEDPRLPMVEDPTEDDNINQFERSFSSAASAITESLEGDEKYKTLDDLNQLKRYDIDSMLDSKMAVKNALRHKLLGKPLEKKMSDYDKSMAAALGRPTGEVYKGKDIDAYEMATIESSIDPNDDIAREALRKYKIYNGLDRISEGETRLDDVAIDFMADANGIGEIYQASKDNGLEFPNVMKGELMYQFLSDPIVQEQAQLKPKFKELYDRAYNGLSINYPEFAEKQVATMVSQAMEDMGYNNPIANAPTQEEVDAVVNKLIADGKMNPLQKEIYEQKIKPTVGVAQSVLRGTVGFIFPQVSESKIVTQDLLGGFKTGFQSGVKGMARGLEFLAGLPLDVTTEVVGNEKVNSMKRRAQIGQALDDMLTTSSVATIDANAINEGFNAAGNFTGFAVPLMLGGSLLEGAGLSSNAAHTLASGLTFSGINNERAMQEFPDDFKKRNAFVGISTLVDLGAFKIFPFDKIKKGVSSMMGNDIKGLVNNLASNKITTDVAKKSVDNIYFQYLKNLGVENLKSATVLTGLGELHKMTDALFGVKNAEGVSSAVELVKEFKSSFLSSSILSAVGAYGKTKSSNKLIANNLLEMSYTPNAYRKVIEEQMALNPEKRPELQEQLDNLDILVSVRQGVEESDMTQAQKEKYILNGTQAKVFENMALKSTDQNVAAEYMRKAEELKSQNEKIFKGEDKAEEYVAFEEAPRPENKDYTKVEEIKEVVDNLKAEIEAGGEAAGQAQLELELITKDPVSFYTKQKEEYLKSTEGTEVTPEEREATSKAYDELIDKIKKYDSEVQAGVSGEVRVGEEPIGTKPVEERGAEEARPSGVLQTPEPGRESEAVGKEEIAKTETKEIPVPEAPKVEETIQEVPGAETVKVEEPVKPEAPKIEEVPLGEVVRTPEEGSTVRIEPQIKNGLARIMVFNEGEWKQQVGGIVTRVADNTQKRAQEQFNKRGGPKTVPSDAVNISVAPYYDTKIEKVEDAQPLRESEGYKNHLNKINSIAKEMGLEVEKIDETIGGFTNEFGNEITEISNRVILKTNDLKAAEEFAAAIGALTHQTQEATIAARYVEHGSPKAVALEIDMKVDNIPGTLEALKEAGIADFEINESTNTVKILDFKNGADPKFNDRMFNFAENLDTKKVNYATEYHAIESTYIDPATSAEILREAESKTQQQQGRPELYNLFKSAREKREEFIVEKEKKKQAQEKGKTLADSIRKLKIDLAQGGLQSNIAGIPIALYNTVVEAVAKAVEGGTYLSKAIKDAVAQYKLKDQEGFNLSELTDKLTSSIVSAEIKSNSAYFENAKEFASKSSYANKLEFKKALQAQLKSELNKLKQIYGKDFDPSKLDEKTKKYLTEIIKAEAVNAVSQHPEAIGWYDEITSAALDVMSILHPEIAENAGARGAFILPLAVMSNGNKVDFNFSLAEAQYEYFKKNGRYNPEGGFGAQQAAIKKSLKLINSLLDTGLTIEDLNAFFTNKYRAGDLKVKVDGKIKNFASGELADEMVYGATLLGPKIGNGFYMNLWGEFEQLTMDRWFMRTFGRLTGTLIEVDKQQVKESENRVNDALKNIKKDKAASAILKEVVGGTSMLSAKSIAKAIQKKSMDKGLREKLESNEFTSELRKASNNLSNKISGEKEAPANGAERKYIRDVFYDVQKRLKEEDGIDITMADLQAVLWYPEKILYESFKEGENFELASGGYVEDSAPDYLNSAKKLVKQKGITDEQINQTLSERGRDTESGFRRRDTETGEPVSGDNKEILGRVQRAIGEPIESKSRKPKELGDKIRKGKIKLGDGGLQSNIAGLPISIYNSVVEAVALSVEAGTTIAQAVSKAIKDFKLNEMKGFNKNEFLGKITEMTGESIVLEENAFESVPKTAAARDKYFEQEFGEEAEYAKSIYNKYKESGDFEMMQKEFQTKGAGVPPTVNKDGNIEGTPESITGITMAANAERRKALGMPERQANPQSFEQWDAEARKLLSEGYDINALIEKMNKGIASTPVENSIKKIYVETLQKQIEANPTNELLSKYKKFIEATEVASSEAGRNLVSLRGNAEPLETLADFYVAKMEANGVSELTEAQKKQVEDAYRLVEQTRIEYQRKLDKANEESAKLQAQAELTSLSKEEKAKKIYTSEGKRDYRAERENLKAKLKELYQGYVNSMNKIGLISDGGAEGFVISAKMAKAVMDIAKSHVEEIGSNLNEVVKKTLDDVKDIFNGITEKDIINVIAGVYSEKKMTQNELTASVRELKTEAKLLNELERVMSGVPKEEKERVEKNRKLEEIRQKIKDLKKQQSLDEYSDEAKVKKAIAQNEKRQQELEQKIANKDFEQKEKPTSIYDDAEFKKNNPELYEELLESYRKKQDALNEFEIEMFKDEQSKRPLSKKAFDFIEAAVNTTKKVVTGIDDSALFMQTLVSMVVRPVVGGKAFAAHLRDMVSKKAFEKSLDELHNSKWWDIIQKSGLDVSEPQSLLEAKKEEIFSGQTLDVKFKIKGKEYGIVKELTAPFERAFTSLGNNMRVISFMTIAEKYFQEGHTFENNPKLFKDLAKMLNTETGRGDINEYAQKINSVLTKGIWSPKLMASRLNLLGISDAIGLLSGYKIGTKGYYKELDPKIRKQAIADLTKFIAAVSAISYGFAYSFGGEVDDDPTSQTFMDVKVGDKSYNFAGGFAQYIRLIAQNIAGGQTRDGKFKAFEEKGKDAGSNTLHFLRGKLTPVSGVVADAFSGMKDFSGQPVTVKDEIQKLTIPLSMQGVSDALTRDGYAGLLTSTLPSFVGINVKDQRDFAGKQAFTAEEQKSDVFKKLKGFGIDVPTFGDRTKYKIAVDKKHKEEGKEKDGTPYALLTEEEYNTFKQYKKDFIVKSLELLFRENDAKAIKLTQQNLSEALDDIKAKSTKIAKGKLIEKGVLPEPNEDIEDEDEAIKEIINDYFYDVNPQN